MTPKIVVVGSCMIDFTCYSPRLPKPGETVVGTKFEKNYGGKGANQCVTAAKLGGSTALIASLGFDTFAQEYLEIFKRENIDASRVKIQSDKHSGIAHIIVAENGENSIVIVLGANESLTPEYVDSAVDVIKSANVLLCQFEVPLETTLRALKLHRGHGLSIVNGAPALENPDPEILRLCDIFCVNETEAEIMTGVQSVNPSNIQQVTDKFLAKGCNAIIITLGPLGAAYASKTNRCVTRILTTEVHPVDTTGAGDAFLGAFAYFKAYHPQLPMDECIRRACTVATRSVLKFGTHASFPTRNDLSGDLFG
ncbi:PREDICTED: ribokinase-like [Wasmannia auropunctata]|uniref:ribokinase-like n=1 Tax=Wasmannia auropunctata TaxID=64793 RepID=UPI0005ED66D6|nr:PREDICTED: ribokinase-like [Wasmannia auropunctata]XP_011687257.1 PREDICTED: ribokinase-like [Wasmannia auropunctata]